MGIALMEFLELPAFLDHVAGLTFVILLVDVEVDGVGTRQFIECGWLVIMVATLPWLCWPSAVTVIVTAIPAVVVSILAMIGVANRDHIDLFALVVDTRSSFPVAITPAAKVIFVI